MAKADTIAVILANIIIMFAAFHMYPDVLIAYGQEDHYDASNKLFSLTGVIGSNRVAPGQFNGPTGLATDSLGNLYVVDSGNKRVQKFSSDGIFLAMWNISDADPHSLYGIEVDSDGKNVYVADFQGGIIWALSESSDSQSVSPSSVQQFNREPYHKSLRSPSHVAIDPSTNAVYVTAGSDGIRKYSANGTLIPQFNENYKNDTKVQLHHTTGLDVDSNGNVYVLAADNPLVNASFVQVFYSNGTFLGSWGGEPLKHPNDMAIDSSDTVYIRDSDSKVKVFTKDGIFLKERGANIGNAPIEQLTGSVGMAFDPNNDNVIYLTDPGNSLVKRYTKDGHYISSIGLASSADGQFEDPQDIEFDSHGNIYVADLQNHRIQKLAPDGTFIAKWGSYCETNAEVNINYGLERSFCVDPDDPQGPLERGDGQFSSPVDITIDSNDNVYVLDGPDNMRIQKFTSDGQFITKFNIAGKNKISDPSAYIRIVGIAVDSDDNVYAAVNDAFPSIQKFSSNGTFIVGWNLTIPRIVNSPPVEDVQYLPENMTLEDYIQSRTVSPWRLAIDSADNIYVVAVVDTFWENYHVQKMSSNGTQLASWGQAGWCKDEFREIREMAFDSLDNLYLVDVSNYRISRYSNNGAFLTLLYPEDIGIKSAQISTMAFDHEDNLYLTIGNTVAIFEPNGKEGTMVTISDDVEDNETAEDYFYEVPLVISEGTLTFLPAHSEDAKIVCGTINKAEKAARLQLLADSMHDLSSRSNEMQLIISDEYLSGIYQIRADDGREIQFVVERIDNMNNASLLEELDLSSSREYTSVRFISPEGASFIDISATNVVPEFGLTIPFLAAVTIAGALIATRRLKKK